MCCSLAHATKFHGKQFSGFCAMLLKGRQTIHNKKINSLVQVTKAIRGVLRKLHLLVDCYACCTLLSDRHHNIFLNRIKEADMVYKNSEMNRIARTVEWV